MGQLRAHAENVPWQFNMTNCESTSSQGIELIFKSSSVCGFCELCISCLSGCCSFSTLIYNSSHISFPLLPRWVWWDSFLELSWWAASPSWLSRDLGPGREAALRVSGSSSGDILSVFLSQWSILGARIFKCVVQSSSCKVWDIWPRSKVFRKGLFSPCTDPVEGLFSSTPCHPPRFCVCGPCPDFKTWTWCQQPCEGPRRPSRDVVALWVPACLLPPSLNPASLVSWVILPSVTATAAHERV